MPLRRGTQAGSWRNPRHVTAAQRTAWLAFAAGVIGPLVAALALVPLRHTIDNANVALVLAAVVVAVAMTGRRPAALTASVSAALWFDFFHTVPYERLTIDSSDDVVTGAVLLVVGVLVGELAIRGRRYWLAAEERSDEIARIHTVAELVADGEPPEHVVIVVAHELRALLELRDCRFEPGASWTDPKPFARLERSGEVFIGELLWPVDKAGFPGDEVQLVVQSQGRTFGRYLMARTAGERVSFERRIVAVALVDQVGAAFAGRPASAGGIGRG
jgi:K+-sensing histidine kinase KdpD